jgi:hypothetical protein
VPKNSIIQYEELKTAAGGSGSGGGGHGSGSGRVKVFRIFPPPVADCAGAGPPKFKFRLPKLERRAKYRAGQIVSIGLCMVGLNLCYDYLQPLSRIIILPLMVYFMWTIWKKGSSPLVGDREED